MMTKETINVVKRNGNKEPLNLDKIHNMLFKACDGLTGVSVSDIALKARLSFYDGITSKEIHAALIKSAADLISETGVNYQYVAGNLLNYDLRKTAWGGMEPPRLFDHITKMTEAGYYTVELLEFYTEEQWDKIEAFIDHDRDFKMTYIGLNEYITKYAMRDRSKKELTPLETPQITYILAAALSAFESRSIKEVKSFYNDFSQWNISLPTPIMAGLRSPTKQFSSCFPAGQKVWTQNGIANIENVSVGDKVLTDDGTYHPVVATRSKIHENNLFTQIRTSFSIKNEFVSTNDHLVKSIKKFHSSTRKSYSVVDWNEVGTLEVGDFVNIPYNRHVTHMTKVNLIDYIIKDNQSDNYVECDDGYIRKISVDNTRNVNYDSKVTPIKAVIDINASVMRMLGYFLAEGHANKTNSIWFTFSSNETQYINDVINIIETEFGLPASVSSNADNSTNVMIFSKVFKDFILTMAGTGFSTKFLNEQIMRISPELQKELLIGVIRGDGCIHKNGMVLGMSNESLIRQLAQIALRCGLYPSLAVRTAEYTNSMKAGKLYFRNDKELKYVSRKDSYQLHLAPTGNYDFLMEVGKNTDKLKISSKSPYLSKYVGGEYYSKILGVTQLIKDDELVFDLQVDNISSFTVSGIAVHNCTLISAGDSLDSISRANDAIMKYAAKKAGIGIDMSRLRAEGAPVGKEKAIKHTGVIPFLRSSEGALKSCSQGGVRGASATATLTLWHLEVLDLIVLKNNKGTPDNRVRKLDYSFQVNNYLYNRLIDGKDITLFSPSDKETPGLYDAFFSDAKKFAELYEKYEADPTIRKKTISSTELFSALMIERKETGRIYIFNVDNVNQYSVFDEPVTTSNLCQEIVLPTVPMATYETEIVEIDENDIISFLKSLNDDLEVDSYRII